MNNYNYTPRLQTFQTELNYFNNTVIRKFAAFCIERLPEYFFHIPASSTGKYHPIYALGEGGLVRHTKAAMGIFHSLTRARIHEYYQHTSVVNDEDFMDAGLLALLLHDGFKSGVPLDFASENAGHSQHEHPLIAAQFVKNAITDFMNEEDVSSNDLSVLTAASNAIASHMGCWTTSKYSSAVLPSPAYGTWLDQMVHLCDYLASRKSLEYIFTAEV